MLQLYHRDRSAWGVSHRDLGDRSAWGAPHRDPGDRIRNASHRDKRSECLGCFSYLRYYHYIGALSDCSIFTCLVTLPFASSCETACSICCGYSTSSIKLVYTHLRIIIAVLQNKFQISLQPDLSSGTVGPHPTTIGTRFLSHAYLLSGHNAIAESLKMAKNRL